MNAALPAALGIDLSGITPEQVGRFAQQVAGMTDEQMHVQFTTSGGPAADDLIQTIRELQRVYGF